MEIAELLKQEARACFPDCECVCLPVADGGEGTMEAVLQARGGVLLETEVLAPLGGVSGPRTRAWTKIRP